MADDESSQDVKPVSPSRFGWFDRVLVVVLVLLLFVNVMQHASSPVYRFYRDNVSRLFKEQRDFRAALLTELLPKISLDRSNLVESVSLEVMSRSSNSLATVSVSASSLSSDAPSLNVHYFVSAGAPAFEFEGVPYFIGSDFYGSPIVYITPTMIRTRSAVYLAHNVPRISPPSAGSSPSRPSSEAADAL